MSKKVLIAPLNWGLGHATRCLPLIEALQKAGAEVTVASDGIALALLRKELPHLPCVEIPAYNIRYPFRSMVLSMLVQMPKILRGVLREHFWLRRFLRENPHDIVISDNRFGLFGVAKKSVFMTHQVHILAPMSGIVNFLNHFWIKKFDALWIPDFQNPPYLSGILGHKGLPKGIATHYIGILSRFKKIDTPKRYFAAVVLSGPEPQRTIWENKILKQFDEPRFTKLLFSYNENLKGKKILFVRGVPNENAPVLEENNTHFEIYNYLTTKELNEKLVAADCVIARSGYSTIMDLAALKIPACLVPTPEQTEQEYLADALAQNNIFLKQTQEAFDVVSAIFEAQRKQNLGKLPDTKNAALEQFIADFLNF